LEATITPFLPDQELALTTVYWEGASKVSGTAGGQPVSGSGYVTVSSPATTMRL